MSWFVVDVEADGPIPATYSMVSFAAVRMDTALATTYRANLAPVSAQWRPQALAVSGVTREQHLAFPAPETVMLDFVKWVLASSRGRAIFVSDNPAFDWQFINWYLHTYAGGSPFGHSARRIGDLWAGLKGDAAQESAWKALRRTKHTHDPLDDAMGNAQALLQFVDHGLKAAW